MFRFDDHDNTADVQRMPQSWTGSKLFPHLLLPGTSIADGSKCARTHGPGARDRLAAPDDF